MLKKRALFFLIVISVSVAAVMGVKFLKPVEVAALRHEKNVPVQVYGLGTIEVHTISRVGFKISGTLVKLAADHGDRVRKGEILALLDPAEQESRVAKAQANVERARASIIVAKAKEERARASLRHKEKLDWRRQNLAQKGVVSVEDADEKRSAVDSQRAGVVMDLLRKVAAEQKTAIIVVTHDNKIFDRLDRIFSLRDGRIEHPAAVDGPSKGETM